ncbi:MAG TPA: chorismate mutase [Pseudonocardiaceae bacterium]|jgi:chorismate mutase-like protein|nr:chorismate mutase [Pseudonocardiaceae bacterium]
MSDAQPTATADASTILAPLRHQLDDVDREILELLVRRMTICLDIARLKADHDIPMMQSSRVNLVVDRARQHAAVHGLPEDYFDDLYRRIIAETCVQEDVLMAELSGKALR